MNHIDTTATISSLCDIEVSTKDSILVIGANSMVDSFVKIKFTGGMGNIEIGSNVYINSGTVIYSGNGVQIGNNVAIAANCTIAPVNHAYKAKNKTIFEQRFLQSKGGIIIGDDVWIGANTVITDGSLIPDGCVIAASSLVRGKLEPYGVYGGNPLQKLGSRE